MITPGVLLIERDASRPRCFEVEADPHPNAWMFIKHTLTPRQLEKELSDTGWTFFFMAGPVRATAFGFNRDKIIYAALNRCIKAVKEQGCNSLQVESVEVRSFLGIPYARVSVRPRHIQRGLLFGGSSIGYGTNISAHELHDNVAVK